MGISKDRLGRFVRAAVVSGLLGAAGLMVTAGPVHAQDGASDGASDGADDGASDGASDGATDGGTATGGATTTTGGTTAGVGAGGGLPQTGNDATAPLVLGGSAVAIALAGRRFLVSRA